ncbi:hypothetical protein BJV74DRAFT_899091 [Russula compacta]|nr:hypothetical protein BJV74DRAFT_899091 [Russula compacta]
MPYMVYWHRNGARLSAQYTVLYSRGWGSQPARDAPASAGIETGNTAGRRSRSVDDDSMAGPPYAAITHEEEGHLAPAPSRDIGCLPYGSIALPCRAEQAATSISTASGGASFSDLFSKMIDAVLLLLRPSLICAAHTYAKSMIRSKRRRGAIRRGDATATQYSPPLPQIAVTSTTLPSISACSRTCPHDQISLLCNSGPRGTRNHDDHGSSSGRAPLKWVGSTENRIGMHAHHTVLPTQAFFTSKRERGGPEEKQKKELYTGTKSFSCKNSDDWGELHNWLCAYCASEQQQQQVNEETGGAFRAAAGSGKGKAEGRRKRARVGPGARQLESGVWTIANWERERVAGSGRGDPGWGCKLLRKRSADLSTPQLTIILIIIITNPGGASIPKPPNPPTYSKEHKTTNNRSRDGFAYETNDIRGQFSSAHGNCCNWYYSLVPLYHMGETRKSGQAQMAHFHRSSDPLCFPIQNRSPIGLFFDSPPPGFNCRVIICCLSTRARASWVGDLAAREGQGHVELGAVPSRD